MKKIFSLILVTAMLLVGSVKLNAESEFWKGYFKEPLESIGGGSMCNNPISGEIEWSDLSLRHVIGEAGGCGGSDPSWPYEFYPHIYSSYLIIDVEGLTASSSDTSILTVELKDYDYSKEKENYNKFMSSEVEWYKNATLEEINAKIKEQKDYGCEECELMTTKLDWWEAYDFESEPTTWWQAYGYDSEPTHTKEILTYAKDLGKANIILSATGKQDITLDWTIGALEFDGSTANGLAEIITNDEKYKNNGVISEFEDYETKKKYNFKYSTSKNEDISSVINAIKGKDLTIKFETYSAGIDSTYFLNGKDVTTTVNKGFTYNHNVSMETSINKDKIDNLVSLENAIYIDFDYHGSLPASYKVNINVLGYIEGQYQEKYECSKYDYDTQYEERNLCLRKASDEAKEYLKNTPLTLLYYNPDTNKMEVVKENIIATEDGDIEIEFDHFSTYVLATSFGPAKNNAQTGVLNVALYIVMSIASLCGIVFLLKKKYN